MDDTDTRFLRRALELADEAGVNGDRPFGSLLVGPDGTVVAEDRNRVRSNGDISAHPELKLAVWAARELDPQTRAGTTMYTSCEPCGMCATAIDVARLGRVVFALSTEQFYALSPASTRGPSPVVYSGPALFDEARVPIDTHIPS